jgi:RES domain-containing protein
MKAIAVDLHRVISLTDPLQLALLGVGVAHTTGLYDWQAAQNRGEESLTQSIGRATFESGMEGLLVPSAADHSAANLVVFSENLPASRRMIVHRSGAYR